MGRKSPHKGQKASPVVMEDQLLTKKEEGGDRLSIGTVSKVTDGGEHDRMTPYFQEKDPHHGKAA